MSLHLSAWPARNDPETAIVRRATLREMHQPEVVPLVSTTAKSLGGETNPQAIGYGSGLRWARDRRQVVSIGHSGGLPGFGSNFVFFPDHGFGVISFANVTYAGTAAPNSQVATLLLEKAGLPPRSVPVANILAARTAKVARLVQSWDAQLGAELAAENFFPDRSLELRAAQAREAFTKLGRVHSVGEMTPENQLRGTFPIHGERGRIDVFFTLTPEATPKLQELRLTFVPKS